MAARQIAIGKKEIMATGTRDVMLTGVGGVVLVTFRVRGSM
jgi:hypothetical protein